jgi:hypothetical protein
MSEFDVFIMCMGAGYVGGPTMAVIAKMCPRVSFRRHLLTLEIHTNTVSATDEANDHTDSSR